VKHAAGDSPWRRIDRARPLQAWRDVELAAVARAVQEPLQAWREAWGLPAQPSPLQCTRATAPDDDARWRLLAAGAQGAAWLGLAPAFEQVLTQALCGVAAAHTPLARGVVVACRDDLPARLLAGLRLTAAGSAPPEPARSPSAWSGEVGIDLEGGVRLLLDAAAVAVILRAANPPAPRSLAPARGPLISLPEAVAGMRLPLHAHLADCELDVGRLQDLRIGDIVSLPHRLDEPLQVRDAAGELVLGGFLARQGPRKALELAAPPNRGAQRP
jgi:hypothetical protein